MAEKIIDLNSQITRAPGCVDADLGGELAILDPDSGTYFSLNKVGAFVWNAIQQPRPVSEVLDAVLGEFEVDRERCSQDLLGLLQELRERQLVKVGP